MTKKRKHNNRGFLDSANILHDGLVKEIYQRPEIIGVDRFRVATATMEFGFRKGWKHYVTPDIAYMLQDGKYVFCEVKSTPTPNLYQKALKQMEKTYECCNRLGFDKAEGWIVQPTTRSNNLERLLRDLKVVRAF